MKAAVIYQPGEAESLKYTDVPTPDVKSGWSLVKVMGFGITHSEVFTRQGKSPSVKFPRILGIECVGVVAKSTEPARLPVGQKVISMNGEMGRDFDGSYAEYVLLPNKQIEPVETKLDWADLAAVPETYNTAYRGMLQLKLAHAKTLLVRGGTSGVGIAALKLVKAMQPNLLVFGTSRHEENRQEVLALGFDGFVCDHHNKLATDQHFDRIFDLVGAASAVDSLQHLTTGGIVSVTGDMGGVWTLDNFDPVTAIPNDCYMTSFASYQLYSKYLNQLFKLIEEKQIDVSPVKVFPLSQIVEAHRYLEQQKKPGKVVVLPELDHQ
ncbi:zinc-binding dehydrogenase [uncultured Limosilactobacillus sp.]|uniref:zinc-binding dehydrogenase n=1 Tax=uncultured Limosilactobacillus sp. TaxID=2837629 RepID=UPI0025E9D80A|nr:zinc-binding dehydrogenase [uncultured Limosilactobacillus sp.]